MKTRKKPKWKKEKDKEREREAFTFHPYWDINIGPLLWKWMPDNLLKAEEESCGKRNVVPKAIENTMCMWETTKFKGNVNKKDTDI